jgi:peptide deformylase
MYPEKVLRQPSELVEPQDINDEFMDLLTKMAYTMYRCNGIGLAAPQVGVSKRLFLFDIDWPRTDTRQPSVLINPRILRSEEETIKVREGCLSLGADYYSDITRAQEVEVLGYNLKFEEIRFVATDLLAACCQHEIDHLNGLSIEDHLGPVRRDMLRRRRNKIKKKARRYVESLHN